MTSTRPTINRDRLLNRFLSYVRIDTAADPSSQKYPSSTGQWELGRQLVQELEDITAEYPHQDEHGLVWATIPATDGGDSPCIALIAHLDTSPEAPSENIQPQVIHAYQGGDIELRSGHVIEVEKTPELKSLVGCTLITTSGHTLLGGDDKAGVAIIMELAQYLIEHPELEHPAVRVLFTCDEEIGRGTDKIDLQKLNAFAAYTIDGGAAGQLDVETFSADALTVTFTGHNIHPAIAKGRMVNAVRAAAAFVERLPREGEAPESTDGREGFLHPYQLRGGVGKATVEILLRSFDSGDLPRYGQRARKWADEIAEAFPGLKVDVRQQKQYRNLGEGLRKVPEVVELAQQAFQQLGRPCRQTIIRGGTDGSQLTEKGLPTPNLSSGQHNIHAIGEFACLDQMVAAIEHLVEMLHLWSQQTRS